MFSRSNYLQLLELLHLIIQWSDRLDCSTQVALIDYLYSSRPCRQKHLYFLSLNSSLHWDNVRNFNRIISNFELQEVWIVLKVIFLETHSWDACVYFQNSRIYSFLL